jgi:tetratricopeptide (TPR) repeat protein
VARLLLERRPWLAERQPELIAEHYNHAGDHASAVPLFARAARRALAASALEEAETQARRGLAAAAELPAARRAEMELDLQVLLGHVLIARRGYANSAVQEAFEKALVTASRLPDDDRVLPLLRGLTSFYQVRGPLSKAAALCDRLVAAAERSGDACMLADAWRRQAWNRFCMGHLAEAEDGLLRALGAFDPERHGEHIAVAGHDPRVLALANLCWLDMLRHGLPRAADRALEVVPAAEFSPHSMSACYGLILAAGALQQAGRWDEALRLAQRAGAIAREKGIVYWTALSLVMIGYDQVHRGDAAAGRAAISEGLDHYRETRGELLRPFILLLLADACLKMEARDAAEGALREAIEVSTTLEAKVFLPKLQLRLACMLDTPDRRAQRMDLLRAAHATARAQGANAVATEARRLLKPARNLTGRTEERSPR